MKWGNKRRLRAPSVVVVVGALLVVLSPGPALAHGEHGPEVIALLEPAGPFVVSVFVEETSDRLLNAHAVVSGSAATSPRLAVAGSGTSATVDDVVEGIGGWEATFVAAPGDTLTVAWGDAADERRSIDLVAPRAPWWFVPMLGLLSPPAIWFAVWLARRSRRAFRPLDLHTWPEHRRPVTS